MRERKSALATSAKIFLLETFLQQNLIISCQAISISISCKAMDSQLPACFLRLPLVLNGLPFHLHIHHQERHQEVRSVSRKGRQGVRNKLVTPKKTKNFTGLALSSCSTTPAKGDLRKTVTALMSVQTNSQCFKFNLLSDLS